MNKGYKTLEIWKASHELVIEIHAMTLNDLPRFELYETGSQIRRAVKSIKSNIVEGYGRRMYKQDFIRFLTYALASKDETMDHLETLYETGSLKDKETFDRLAAKIDLLGGKLYKFIKSVVATHNTFDS